LGAGAALPSLYSVLKGATEVGLLIKLKNFVSFSHIIRVCH